MSKRKKRLQKIQQNPNNVSFEDLSQLLKDYNINLVRSRGSHHYFVYTVDGQEKLFVVPYAKPVNSFYVKAALRLISSISVEESGDEADE